MRTFVALWVLLVIVVGCGGGGGGGPAVSPFAGHWQGTWLDTINDIQGTLDITIGTDGSLSGSITNITQGIEGTASGTVTSAAT